VRSLLAGLVVLALLVATLPVGALVRPQRAVEVAISHSGPRLPRGTVRTYASILVGEGKARQFDPLTVIAMVHYESRWHPGLVNANGSGYYVGLGQIDAYNGAQCKRDGLDSPGCQARIASLKDGSYNLRRVAANITANRKFCRAKTGHPALFARWLSSYQGYNNHARSGRSGAWCNMRRNSRGVWYDLPVPKLTRRVIQYRRHLIRYLRQRGLR